MHCFEANQKVKRLLSNKMQESIATKTGADPALRESFRAHLRKRRAGDARGVKESGELGAVAKALGEVGARQGSQKVAAHFFTSA